jgi:Tfp pilus assembly protein PilN
MNNGSILNLNLATRPLRNRRLYGTAVRLFAGLLVVLAGLTVFAILKYGGEASRLKATRTGNTGLQSEADREVKRLTADIKQVERTSRARVDLVNGIILRKTFSWTGLLTELENALPGPSYITSLSPDFTASGAVTMSMRVTSRSLEDVLAFINNLTARGFKNIQVFGDRRSEDGRIITEMSLTYERAL